MMSLQTHISDLTVSIRNKLNTMTPRLLPSGGETGNILVKKTDTSYETEWAQQVGPWEPVTSVGTGVQQSIQLPETCLTEDVMVFVKGIFQHAGYAVVGDVLVTTQPAGFEIVIIRYGTGLRGRDGIDGSATVESVIGLALALSLKSDTNHTHLISDITGLQEELNELADLIMNAAENAGNQTYEWTAPTASSSWIIPHNLNRYPSVTIVDSAGSVFQGDITYIDINTVKVDFSYPTGGKALLV